MKDASTNTEYSVKEKKDAGSQTDDIKGKEEKSDVNESSEGSSTDIHELDPDYDGPCYPSQACFGRHGVSYTPPGWRRRRIKRKKLMTRDVSEEYSDD